MAALGEPNFRLFWVGLFLSNVGSWIQTVAQGWLVYELTDSSAYLGAVGASRAVPLVALSLVGGTFADRFDRRRLLYATNAASAALALALAVDTWLGWVRPWHVLATSFLAAAVLAFDQPARQALLPALVPRELLLNAISLNSMTFNGAAILGSALGGALVAPIGTGGCFFVNGLSFGIVILALRRMRLPSGAAGSPGRPGGSLLGDLAEALAYVRRRRVILALLVTAAGTSFFARGYQALLPVFARDVLAVGVRGLGWLSAAPGAGTVAGALSLAALGEVGGKGRLLLATSLGLAGTLVGFAYARSLVLAALLLLLSGAFSILASATLQTLLQLGVDDRMRGRVMSMYTLTMLGMMPLGQLPLGAAADLVGAPAAVALGALLAALCVSGAALWEPRLARAR
ncbi:MAG: MFS transporter [Clostridia bacterium]|nr:MFS transporter [Clostridia bacterium]